MPKLARGFDASRKAPSRSVMLQSPRARPHASSRRSEAGFEPGAAHNLHRQVPQPCGRERQDTQAGEREAWFVKAADRVNSRAESSHQPTRERERRVKGFRISKRTQAFLSAFGTNPSALRITATQNECLASSKRPQGAIRRLTTLDNHGSRYFCSLMSRWVASLEVITHSNYQYLVAIPYKCSKFAEVYTQANGFPLATASSRSGEPGASSKSSLIRVDRAARARLQFDSLHLTT
ncbi:hypothetical protein BN2476_1240037 [Paraburkholderia piptadeniae]|uniref:Transposase n=1 Tax=Paraburkholderia piptadeniae TaxID=1701573 RepID=A0A1N7SVS2_9BURK|nr:hypothetical protein BN2476_1240037 [Paraburkholderia piptadeniae]